ncbi:MAG: class I SAM-dependent methyltransferase [Acidobacteria bacterium]|nr:class I SAM-dependent methyltransferase [Acidobacteriota bacterium]
MELNWHRIYQKQAEWTQSTRNYLFRRAGLHRASIILEAGCATGVITNELASRTSAITIGIDNDLKPLSLIDTNNQNLYIACADVHKLPFKKGLFDAVITNYLLIWLENPNEALKKLYEFIRPGGYLLICAEPDYDGIIEYPDSGIKTSLIKSLQDEGLQHTDLGRKMNEILSALSFEFESGFVNYSSSGNVDDILSIIPGINKNQIGNGWVFIQPIYYAIIHKPR